MQLHTISGDIIEKSTKAMWLNCEIISFNRMSHEVGAIELIYGE